MCQEAADIAPSFFFFFSFFAHTEIGASPATVKMYNSLTVITINITITGCRLMTLFPIIHKQQRNTALPSQVWNLIGGEDAALRPLPNLLGFWSAPAASTSSFYAFNQ